MPPKSVFRQPGAKHFQLVHRSQRDPLIHDPDASQYVLRPIERENVKKGKSRSDLESILPASEIASDRLGNVGEAALYGIYYDDTEYNYMQHLRAVGVQEDGVESVLIEASSSSKSSKVAKKVKGIEMRDLPEGVLASKSELPRTYESQQAIPESIAGFQPDMDPHLRQVLEALDDDAFVNGDLEDDFFTELVADGERGSDEEVDYEFEEYGYKAPSGSLHDDDEEVGWEERFAQFKQSQQKQVRSDDGYDESEGGDTVGILPDISVIGGKKRRKGTSDASGYSMSSSSMYRNEALQTLDERFDQMMIKQYADDDDDDDIPSVEDDDSDEAPELITSREDFESMMNEFLHDYEILGRKMKPKLLGDTGAEKLDTIRRALGQDDRVRLGNQESDEEDDILMPLDLDDKQDRWDCETILTTYSNLENHPRLIRARDSKPVAKITLDPKTGFPTVVNPQQKLAFKKCATSRSDYQEYDSDDTDTPVRQTITRPRNESKEDKKARKAAVKAERQARRIEKKATSEVFGSELQLQKLIVANKEKKFKKL
ncbi:Protein LTV1 [Termitomyces sp. T112]|nr:hypothetical protein C0989_000408 [Termitomyces sp. Mn162]KAG5718703.1 Protein LTV1 [Termitomyces sp. T112]KAH0591209.1 hypothetical protein H2248_001302 [Termitomyces sp. 'cryptogamus']KNZ80574.1 Protein LTV1 [Termitomyces sp. J132]